MNHPFWGTPIFGNTHIVDFCKSLVVFFFWKCSKNPNPSPISIRIQFERNSTWILKVMFSKKVIQSHSVEIELFFDIDVNLQGCSTPKKTLREEPAWQEKP